VPSHTTGPVPKRPLKLSLKTYFGNYVLDNISSQMSFPGSQMLKKYKMEKLGEGQTLMLLKDVFSENRLLVTIFPGLS